MTSYVTLSVEHEAEARRHASQLIEQLISSGALSSSEWRAAFERTPRHLFAPQFRLPDNLGGRTLAGTDPEQVQDWLRAAYANDALLTDFASDGTLLRTCSSPSVVARMLEALDVAEGMSVLEIGTGTGWNAGLLATRLGSDAVTSVDIDSLFVQQARERLAVLDLHPTLDAADGFGGYPARGPYDRIIATCSVRQFPPAWLQQIGPGGMILTDVRGTFAGGLALVSRNVDGTVTGGFLQSSISFMPLHSPEVGVPSTVRGDWPVGRVVSASGDTRTTELDPAVLRQPDSFSLFAQIVIPGALVTPVSVGADRTVFCLVHPDGAWARVELGDALPRRVTQEGDRRLWDELEAAHDLWSSLDRPARDQFTITITADGEQSVSVAGTSHRWRLPL